MNTRYTLCIFSENSPGVLQRITVLFTRRKLNIESLTVSETEKPGVSRFTLVVNVDRALVEKVAGQIRRIIEVLEVSVCENTDLVFKEIAFYKVFAENLSARKEIQDLAEKNHGSIVHANESHLVVEKTGDEDEIRKMYAHLEPYGIREFVRSGRIALHKSDRVNG